MKTAEPMTGMPPELREEAKLVIDRLKAGIPFTKEEQAEAAAEIDRMREANAKRLGVQDVTLDIIREMRSR